MSDQQKPWGDDSEFDAEKAWNLIQNLRGEVATLKESKQQLATERDEANTKASEAAAKAEELKATVQLTDDAVKDREQQYASLSTLRTKENLLIDAGLPRDLAPSVVGDDEDAWKTTVERLSSLRGEASQERRPDPAQVAAPEIDDRTLIANQLFGSD